MENNNEIINVKDTTSVNPEKTTENKKKKDYGKISKTIGIISIISVFILMVFVFPISIVGLVFGLKHKKEDGKLNIGIILNVISILLMVPIYLVYSNWLFNPVNPVVGTWNCSTSYENPENYAITLKLNRNKTFIWNKYGDAENNYVKGKFEFKDLKKSSPDMSFFYYSIKLTSDNFVSGGQLQSQEYKSNYEIGVGTSLSKARNKAVLINEASYNMYYCTLIK